jgi:hypothetical protein
MSSAWLRSKWGAQEEGDLISGDDERSERDISVCGDRSRTEEQRWPMTLEGGIVGSRR